MGLVLLIVSWKVVRGFMSATNELVFSEKETQLCEGAIDLEKPDQIRLDIFYLDERVFFVSS